MAKNSCGVREILRILKWKCRLFSPAVLQPTSAIGPLVVFAHGKESGPWGSKIKHLAVVAKKHGANVLSPDYADLADPDVRVDRLLALDLPAHERLILVGSSMGGYPIIRCWH